MAKAFVIPFILANKRRKQKQTRDLLEELRAQQEGFGAEWLKCERPMMIKCGYKDSL